MTVGQRWPVFALGYKRDLFHPTSFAGYSRSCHRIGNSLQLRFHCIRIDGITAVNGRDNAFHVLKLPSNSIPTIMEHQN